MRSLEDIAATLKAADDAYVEELRRLVDMERTANETTAAWRAELVAADATGSATLPTAPYQRFWAAERARRLTEERLTTIGNERVALLEEWNAALVCLGIR